MIFHKKEKSCAIYAPVSGKAVELSQVPDEVFSGKVLGDGAAVIPEDGTIVSPVDGTVATVPDTHHAYYVRSKDGLEILIHVRIDTVDLKGEGFQNFVKAGQNIKTGDILVKADLNLIREKGLNPIVPVVITNMDAVNRISATKGIMEAGKTTLITYERK